MLRTLLTCLIICPTLAIAQDDALARMEAGTVQMTNNLLNFYESRVPELADVRPDMSWDAEMRTAGQCILDGLMSHGGDASVQTYLAALEDFAATEITTFTEMTTKMPEALSDAKVLEFSSSCGMIELGSAKMDASGLNEAFQADGVLDRVLAPAE